jgi:flotillin
MSLTVLISIGAVAFIVAAVLLAMLFRVVVSTNDVHIVQSAKRTMSYGKDQPSGNTYYKWPAWMPRIGIRVITLPVSVFDVDLDGYAAYDKGRVPFVIDIMAFFRITDSNLAAQRVSTFEELKTQLQGILQGACRSILARSEIEEILEGRSTFGELFTKEVDHNLEQWGVQSVKQIELMDIRDAANSKVIANIMAKKSSLIERESRVAVADNQRAAQVAEIEAGQIVQVRQAEAAQLVGQRNADKDREVGISNQKAAQAIKEQEKVTTEKHMAVVQVQQVRQAEITRDVQVVQAEQQKRVMIVEAEGVKSQTVTLAEGNLEQAKLVAKGIEVEGAAKGAAETAILLAPVTTQITLAKEIGGNDGYQKYLVSVRAIEKDQAVGIAQAEALKRADVKVIANTGAAVDGVKSVMDLFTSKGGAQMGAMVEALAQNPVVGSVLKRLGGNGNGASAS